MPISLTEGKSRAAQVLSQEKKKTRYFRELKDELKKVSWVSKGELKSCANVVIGTTFCFGSAIYLADLCIRNVLTGIESIARWVFG